MSPYPGPTSRAGALYRGIPELFFPGGRVIELGDEDLLPIEGSFSHGYGLYEPLPDRSSPLLHNTLGDFTVEDTLFGGLDDHHFSRNRPWEFAQTDVASPPSQAVEPGQGTYPQGPSFQYQYDDERVARNRNSLTPTPGRGPLLDDGIDFPTAELWEIHDICSAASRRYLLDFRAHVRLSRQTTPRPAPGQAGPVRRGRGTHRAEPYGNRDRRTREVEVPRPAASLMDNTRRIRSAWLQGSGGDPDGLALSSRLCELARQLLRAAEGGYDNEAEDLEPGEIVDEEDRRWTAFTGAVEAAKDYCLSISDFGAADEIERLETDAQTERMRRQTTAVPPTSPSDVWGGEMDA